MAKCKECNEEIESLYWESKATHTGAFLKYNGDYEVEQEPFDIQEWHESFFCPECKKELFKDRDDAIEFLRGNL